MTRLVCLLGVWILVTKTTKSNPICVFGSASNCIFPCHCANDASCDPQTGQCPGGCRSGTPQPNSDVTRFNWRGPACQIGNIGLNKPANQLGQYGTYEASYGVDGILGRSSGNANRNCAHPDGSSGRSAWWRVDLGGLYVVFNVTVFNTFDYSGSLRMKEFVIGVGNATGVSGHTPCDSHGSPAVAAGGDVTLTCNSPLYGRYVSFRRTGGSEMDLVTLCEVVIIGHKAIQADCSRCRSGVTCDSILGCRACVPGYSPVLCNERCRGGTYGESCASSCDGHRCQGGSSTCSHVDGTCPGDCDQWYTERTCSAYIKSPKLDRNNNVTVIAESNGSLRVSWHSEDGISSQVAPFIGYLVDYKPRSTSQFTESLAVAHVDGRDYQSTVISGLQYNTRYTVRIRVYREQGGIREISDWPTGEVTDMTACTGPDAASNVNLTSTTPSSFHVTWQVGSSGCNSIHAVVILYRRSGASLWLQYDVPDPSTTTSVTVANLQDTGTYQVKLRVTNDQDISTDTESSSVTIDAQVPSDGGVGVGVIAGAVVTALIILAAVIIGVVCIVRRKRSSRDVPDSHTMSASQHHSLMASSPKKPTGVVNPIIHEIETDHAIRIEDDSGSHKLDSDVDNDSIDHEAIDTPLTSSRARSPADDATSDRAPREELPCGIISVSQLEQQIRQKDIVIKTITVKDNDGEKNEAVDGFKEEFDSLPGDDYALRSVGQAAKNRAKNRFANIQPFDDTRVILEKADDHDSDYVNASYIRGYSNQAKHYIASQGPTPKTVNDFWRMIWQQGVNRIVMLTGLIEGGKIKSHQYWSGETGSAKAESFGDYVVSTVFIEEYADYAYRKLSILFKDERREVHQLHFLSWKDKSCPDEAFPLLAFRERVHGLDAVAKGPLVVHCSAGVGRTGTYIAIDYLIDEATRTGQVDVLRCVQQLRTQRMHMVQTKRQYRFVYQALLDATETQSIEPAISCPRFNEQYQALIQDNAYSNQTPLIDQFLMLSRWKSRQTARHVAATKPENVSKSRYEHVLPDDDHRPRLYTRYPQGNDYINAVFTDSFKHLKATILTQMPLPSTVSDFWRLVYDERCSTVVMLNDMDPDDPTCISYWPSEEGAVDDYGPLRVELVRTNDTSTVISREFSVTKSKTHYDEDPVRMCQFQLLSWPRDHTLPPQMEHLVELMELVTRWQQQCHNDKAVIHCMNGADRSGLFAAACYVVDKMKVDQEVNVSLASRYVTSRRSEAINSPEQYESLFNIAKCYMDGFETYANFK